MLLNIKDLTVSLEGYARPLVRGVDLRMNRGEITALVGGSGSGKTTLGLAILGLLDPGLTISSGRILWKGEDLRLYPKNEMRKTRGADIAMIFQEPLNAFDPLFTIQEQIDEVLRAHKKMKRRDRRETIMSLLSQAGIADIPRVMRSYPHQLSGGMCQRAMIAQSLAGSPSLIVADEPTSSIDVTLQARVIEMFRRLRRELNVSFLLITHDFGVVRNLADRVYVMNQGEVVESGTVSEVLDHPESYYTKQLIEAAA